MAGDRILAGVIGAAHGVRGELRLKSHTGDPLAIASYGPLSDQTGRNHYDITSARLLKDDMLVVRIRGISDRSQAEALTHTELYIDRNLLPEADEEEFYHADLIGLRAETADGAVTGTILAVQNFGAGDILEIQVPGVRETLLLPFTRAIVPVVDIKGGRVVIEPPHEVEVKEGEADGEAEAEQAPSNGEH